MIISAKKKLTNKTKNIDFIFNNFTNKKNVSH